MMENKEEYRVGSMPETLDNSLFKTGKNKAELMHRIGNLIDIYLADFDDDICYEIFDNWLDITNENKEGNSKYRVDKKEETLFYTMNGKNFILEPKNVEQFIMDCKRVWDIPLYWDRNLVNRNFKIYR